MYIKSVSGISAHFRNSGSESGSWDELWSFQVVLATFKYGRALQSETTKTPSTLQGIARDAHSCRILSSNSASRPPLFLPSYCSTSLPKHLTLWNFQCISLEPEGDLSENFAKHFFSFGIPFSYESEHPKLMNSLIINLSWQFSTGNRFHGPGEGLNKSQGH